MKYSTSRVEFNTDIRDFMLGQFVFDLRSLYAFLEQLTDLRDPRGVRYQLADALTLTILAKLGGEDEPQGMADWLKHQTELLVSALALPRASMPHFRPSGRGERSCNLRTYHSICVKLPLTSANFPGIMNMPT